MKINIISASNLTNAATDVEVLKFMFKKSREKIDVQDVNVNNYKCPNASINIFLQGINYQFLHHAKINIAIVDHENMTESVVDYLPNMDYVFCKSDYSFSVIETALKRRGYGTKNLVTTGWRSPNIEVPCNKDFNKVLFYCNQRNSDIYQRMIDAWTPELPQLQIVGAANNVLLRNPKLRKSGDNIVFQDTIQGHEFHKLFNECGYHLILEDKASYEHLINQCQQVGSIPVALYGGSNKELFSNDTGFPLSCKKRKSDDNRLGSRFSFNPENVVNKFTEIAKLSQKSIDLIIRDAKISTHKATCTFESKFLEIFKTIFGRVRSTKKINFSIKEDDLPSVSIITPTYNRNNFFPLAIYNYNLFNYPRDKLEWIIVDDSDADSENTIEQLLPPSESRDKYRIKYIKLEQKHTIGAKRNIAIKNSSNSIIMCMDDDDYYYPNSIKNRVEILMAYSERNENIQGVCCGTFAGFEINKYISIINNKNISLPFYQKLSPATLLFKRDFVDLDNENMRFADSNKFEAETLVKGRVNNLLEVTWEDNIVSLIHNNNTSDMRVPGDEKPNGCHFKFSEKLFKFITGLDKELKK